MISFLEHLNSKVFIWLPNYLRKSIIRGNSNDLPGARHIMFIFVDHFEPQVGGAAEEKQKERVDIWMEKYPTIASSFVDADGKHPQHTWFYPYDEYRSEEIKLLSQLCYDGFGEIEMHLHHKNDTSDSLRRKLNDCKAEFAKFGVLITAEQNPRSVYGFIHGDWGLDNSRGVSFCGVNNELQVLSETGCFADFTFPSPGHSSQPRKINSIYYAEDDPDRPKSYDQGTDVRVGGNRSGDLMIIQGTLGLRWKSRKYYVLPRIETGFIRGGSGDFA